jgi:beta-xylosidase
MCRVDGVYYLACSSFEYAPGVPLFRSTDLRTWEPIGHALDRPSQLDLAGAWASGGIYAPTLRHHDGRFWMITTNVSDGGGHLLVTASDPAGRWSDPVRFPALAGIDPDLAWDAAGTCWLTWTGTHPGTGAYGILQAPVDPVRGEATGEIRQLWSGSGGKAPEAPHLYEIEGVWYLVVAEGGTERGHAVSVARGPAPSGPFVGNDRNPILTRRGTHAAVQATGHGDLVRRSDGSWAMVHLGVRPVGASQDFHVLGRETFALEIDWVDGWPVVGRPIEGAGADGREQVDAFPAGPFDSAWVSPGRFPEEVTTGGEDLTLVGDGRGLDAADPALIARRQEHQRMTVRADADVSDGVGGLTLRIDERHHYSVEADAGEVRVVARIGPLRQVVASAPAAAAAGRWTLGIDVVERADGGPTAGPDTVVLGYCGAQGWVPLAHLDGRYLSTEVAGGFTGRFVGIFATAGFVRIARFSYTGSSGDELG